MSNVGDQLASGIVSVIFLLLLGLGVAGLFLALIPAAVAKQKGRSFLAWWLYGMLLLIVALPHAILARPLLEGIERRQEAAGLKECPFCAEMIKPDAKVCRYCGRDLPLDS